MSAAHGVLAIGSNVGDRVTHLQTAVDVIAARIGVIAVSPVYDTDPVGGPDQPPYLNAVVFTAPATPRALLQAARAAEKRAHRVRGERWGPRTLDVDVIACGDVVSDDPELTVPHPRAHERAFVLAPWHDLDPAAVLPGFGPVADLLTRAGTRRVRRRDDTVLEVPR